MAVDNRAYTPPEEVVKIKNDLSLLPSLYAGNGDFIVIPDEVEDSAIPFLKYFDLAKSKNLNIIQFHKIPENLDKFQNIHPWGWDLPIYYALKSRDVADEMLPSLLQLNKIRELSHRHTAIVFRKYLSKLLNRKSLHEAQELFSVAEAEEFLKTYPVAYFKAPWSSSGRGLIVSDHISTKGLKEWVHGMVKRQGSVIAETAWDRVFDFASEWWIDNGETKFLGFSVFETSSRGKYHGNFIASQDQIKKKIEEKCGNLSQEIVEAQYHAINELIAPFYSGPLGIDMFSDRLGNINWCVEINLRFTMGLINLDPLDTKATYHNIPIS